MFKFRPLPYDKEIDEYRGYEFLTENKGCWASIPSITYVAIRIAESEHLKRLRNEIRHAL